MAPTKKDLALFASFLLLISVAMGVFFAHTNPTTPYAFWHGFATSASAQLVTVVLMFATR